MILIGSEGRLAFPYQRVGMVNAVQELSYSADGKYLISLSRTVCSFLLSYYKDEGIAEAQILYFIFMKAIQLGFHVNI